jgi:hypothetical protein
MIPTSSAANHHTRDSFRDCVIGIGNSIRSTASMSHKTLGWFRSALDLRLRGCLAVYGVEYASSNDGGPPLRLPSSMEKLASLSEVVIVGQAVLGEDARMKTMK